MSKEEYEVYCAKCRYNEAAGVARAFIINNPAHTFREDYERFEKMHMEIALELEEWLQDVKLNGMSPNGIPTNISKHLIK